MNPCFASNASKMQQRAIQTRKTFNSTLADDPVRLQKKERTLQALLQLIDKYIYDYDSLVEKYHALNQLAEQRKQTIDTQRQQIERLETENVHLKQQQQSQMSANAIARPTNHDECHDHLECNMKLEALRQELSHAQQSFPTAQETVLRDQQSQRLKSLESLVSELRQQQTVTVSENDRLNQENMALNEECKQCKLELQQVKAQHNQLMRNQKLDLSKYQEWSQAEVVQWIMALDNGAFQKYEAKLTESFVQSEFDGSSLNDVLKSDIADFGINNFKDKTALYRHIENLKTGEHAQSSQIAPAEGGGTLHLY